MILGVGLPRSHPLVKFAQKPDKIESALALDDTVIWGALALMADSKDGCISKFAQRLRDRQLYKCIDLRAKIARNKSDAEATCPEADTLWRHLAPSRRLAARSSTC